ncbi:MAG: hypothetical protein AMK69_21955 [Nitrospira bacterium SG8_3]|nr:MAG: hypothetical protein AMK69_21955 [Nitrospira bacterium SG8_3]
MPISVILHISNEEPIIGDIEGMPQASDSVLILHNPRKRDGKDVPYLDTDVTVVIYPWEKINFVEIMPAEAEEEIIGFVRE